MLEGEIPNNSIKYSFCENINCTLFNVLLNFILLSFCGYKIRQKNNTKAIFENPWYYCTWCG